MSRHLRNLGPDFVVDLHRLTFLLSLHSCSCSWPSLLRVLTPTQHLESLRVPRKLLPRNAARISGLRDLRRALR